MDVKLGMLCITLAKLWQSDRDGLQGVFLQPIARLLAIKKTRQTARVRLITDRRSVQSVPNSVDAGVVQRRAAKDQVTRKRDHG